MAKERPRTYGDKVTQEITGKEGEPIISKESTLETTRWIASILYQAEEHLEQQGS